MNPLSLFHPAVAAWFECTFAAPTAAQLQAWSAIQAAQHVLIAAPTGSGKTLAAFLAAIDALVKQGINGELRDETQIVYVSPLKALSNDIQRNLEAPLAGIRANLRVDGLPDVDIRTWVRTGDTPANERHRMGRRPPHIVVTTPESLYILLGSESGRRMLATTRSVIVDEIHALAPNKRGTHLALSLERLAALCGNRLLRIGLSATQKPVETVARFLVGTGAVKRSGNPRQQPPRFYAHLDRGIHLGHSRGTFGNRALNFAQIHLPPIPSHAPVRRQRRVDRAMIDCPEPSLDGACVAAFVGQRVPTRPYGGVGGAEPRGSGVVCRHCGTGTAAKRSWPLGGARWRAQGDFSCAEQLKSPWVTIFMRGGGGPSRLGGPV
jgi:DEAD/DEAH box helicase